MRIFYSSGLEERGVNLAISVSNH